MKITLRKVTKIPLDFEIKSNEITFKGFLQYHSNKLILLKAKLDGFIDVDCSQCAEKFNLKVNEDIEFFISDGLYDSDEAQLDVIESFDSIVDLDELLNSEIELIKSDYLRCDSCQS